MPLVLKDRVRSTTTTAGTGTVTLSTAATGFQAFSVIGNGNSTFYTIVDPATSAWEVGVGTYTSASNTLTRTTVLDSSNAGALVNFGAGIKDIFVTYPAGRSVTGAPGMVENSTTISASYTITDGNNAMSAGPVTIASGAVITVPGGSVWTIV